MYPSVSSPSSPTVRVCPAAAPATEEAPSTAFPLVSAVPSQSQAVLAPRMRLPSLYHSSSLLLLRLGIPPLTGVSLFSLVSLSNGNYLRPQYAFHLIPLPHPLTSPQQLQLHPQLRLLRVHQSLHHAFFHFPLPPPFRCVDWC